MVVKAYHGQDIAFPEVPLGLSKVVRLGYSCIDDMKNQSVRKYPKEWFKLLVGACKYMIHWRKIMDWSLCYKLEYLDRKNFCVERHIADNCFARPFK